MRRCVRQPPRPARLPAGPCAWGGPQRKMAADSEVSVFSFLLSRPVPPRPVHPQRSRPATASPLTASPALSPQPESEVFEITDFTTASEWERYGLRASSGAGAGPAPSQPRAPSHLPSPAGFLTASAAIRVLSNSVALFLL